MDSQEFWRALETFGQTGGVFEVFVAVGPLSERVLRAISVSGWGEGFAWVDLRRSGVGAGTLTWPRTLLRILPSFVVCRCLPFYLERRALVLERRFRPLCPASVLEVIME